MTDPPAAVQTAEQHAVLVASAPLVQRWSATLAGSMALALQLGHTRSADFDRFTPQTLSPAQLLKDLQSLPLSVRAPTQDGRRGDSGGPVRGDACRVARRACAVGRPAEPLAPLTRGGERDTDGAGGLKRSLGRADPTS